MTKYKYFFGSDSRSIPYLETIFNSDKNIKVITTPPIQKGRGKKFILNDVEEYCINNEIEFFYYKSNDKYNDMVFGISASFSKIFNPNFLKNNNKIYNIHLSLLPELRGPSPVEFTILNNFSTTGITVFEVNESIDTGKIVYQEQIHVGSNDYASDLYKKLSQVFNKSYNLIDFNSDGTKQTGTGSLTSKFSKSDLCIVNDNLNKSKLKIRAFNVLGPAYTIYRDKILKIHSYSNVEDSEGIMFEEGVLYPEYVTPEGKNKMLFPDYIRGIKWKYLQVYKLQINLIFLKI